MTQPHTVQQYETLLGNLPEFEIRNATGSNKPLYQFTFGEMLRYRFGIYRAEARKAYRQLLLNYVGNVTLEEVVNYTFHMRRPEWVSVGVQKQYSKMLLMVINEEGFDPSMSLSEFSKKIKPVHYTIDPVRACFLDYVLRFASHHKHHGTEAVTF